MSRKPHDHDRLRQNLVLEQITFLAYNSQRLVKKILE